MLEKSFQEIIDIAVKLKLSFPNLKYMKSFNNEYKDNPEFVQLVAQLA